MGAVPKPSRAKDPRFTWESESTAPPLLRAVRAPLRMFGIGVNVHSGVVTRKVRQPLKQLVPDASGIGVAGTGAPPTNATWIYLDDAEIPVGWAGREPPKVPQVGDHVELRVSPVTGTLLRTKFRKPAPRR
ncbi:MAG: hypothetical protein RIB98_07565 [Acidimicrobiales bacterium]